MNRSKSVTSSLVCALCLLSGGAAHGATFEVANCDTDPRWGSMAAPGTASVSPATVDVGEELGLGSVPPLTIEVALPEDALVIGRGLPPLLPGDDPLLTDGYEVDRSVLQIELPILRPPASAEEEVETDHTAFTAPRVCVVDAPYLPPGGALADTGHTGLLSTGDTGSFDADDYADATCPYDLDATLGMWRAWKVRDDPADGSCTVTEVQLARTIYDQVDRVQTVPRMGVWLEEGDTLEGGDRVLVEMQTKTPLRATDWTDTPYAPNIRWAHTSCPGFEDASWPADCFDMLDREAIDGVEVTAGPPSFLRINMPLDVVRGEAIEANFVLLDAYGNPTSHTSDPAAPIVVTTRHGVTGTTGWSHDITFDGTWKETAPVPLRRRGPWTIDADVSGSDLPDLTVIRHWTRAWQRMPKYRRAAGDLHFHTGITEDPVDFARARFVPTGTAGDHRAQAARTELAYEYLSQVMGLQFGAASEHATAPSNYTLPADPAFDVFRPGGVCDIGPIIPEVPDWWANLQQLDQLYQQPDFTVFPAFEWHAHQRSTRNGVDVSNSRLHRVIVYREVPAAMDLPMLPGTEPNLPPQCLPLFMIAKGWADPARIEDMVTIPHLSRPMASNLDWDLTYDWSGEFADLLATLDPNPDVARQLMEQQTRLIEVFSARARANDSFEGRWTDGTDPERWSIRYGLSQGARVGFIGNSDNHGQVPGSNDDRLDSQVGPTLHHHEPGGLAFVLRESTAPTRDGIFDGLRGRRTYATSGIRAWMDVRLTDPAMPMMHAIRMGESYSTTSCSLELDVELAAGMQIQNIDLLAAQVQQLPGGVSTSWRGIRLNQGLLPSETYWNTTTIPHPGVAGEFVYYVRGRLGSPAFPEQEMAWASPIWITWDEPGLCPP